MSNMLKFARLHPTAIIPTKRNEDAGYDIYACLDENITIKPMETKLIPTGLASSFSNNYYIQFKERGSTGSLGLKVSGGVIDSGYRNEWMVAITNCSDKDIVIDQIGEEVDIIGNSLFYPITKAIAQFVVLPVPKMTVLELSANEIMRGVSDRGTGNFGSSGK